MIRDRLASSEHQRAYMEDIHEQVWICTEGDGGYIIWGKGLHGENVFAGGDVYIFDDFIRINESGTKKTTLSILLLYSSCVAFLYRKRLPQQNGDRRKRNLHAFKCM